MIKLITTLALAAFIFPILDCGHRGAEINFTDYVSDNEKVSYSDLSTSVYEADDFYKNSRYALFAKVDDRL